MEWSQTRLYGMESDQTVWNGVRLNHMEWSQTRRMEWSQTRPLLPHKDWLLSPSSSSSFQWLSLLLRESRTVLEPESERNASWARIQCRPASFSSLLCPSPVSALLLYQSSEELELCVYVCVHLEHIHHWAWTTLSMGTNEHVQVNTSKIKYVCVCTHFSSCSSVCTFHSR